jgi:hypothetical protein
MATVMGWPDYWRRLPVPVTDVETGPDVSLVPVV